jgi:hypothetical protein
MRVGRKLSARGKNRSIDKDRARFYRLRADRIERELKAMGKLITPERAKKKLAAFESDLKGVIRAVGLPEEVQAGLLEHIQREFPRAS